MKFHEPFIIEQILGTAWSLLFQYELEDVYIGCLPDTGYNKDGIDDTERDLKV